MSNEVHLFLESRFTQRHAADRDVRPMRDNPIESFFLSVFLLVLFGVVFFISSVFVSETWAVIFGGAALFGWILLIFYADSPHR